MHLSPRIHQEYNFRHRSEYRTPSKNRQECLTSGKEYIEPHKTRQDKQLGGKTGVLVGLDLPLAGGGTEAGVQSPHPLGLLEGAVAGRWSSGIVEQSQGEGCC